MSNKSDQHLLLLGAFASHWDRIEAGCESLFSALLKHPASSRIYLAVRSFETRLDIIKATVLSDNNATNRDINLHLIERIKKASAMRNRILHGQWVYLTPENALRVAMPDDWEATSETLRNWLTKHPSFQKEYDRYIFDMDRLAKLCSDLDELASDIFATANNLSPH